ncbi:hypothetical protein FE77_14885, partial [Staphylococcus aureus]
PVFREPQHRDAAAAVAGWASHLSRRHQIDRRSECQGRRGIPDLGCRAKPADAARLRSGGARLPAVLLHPG